MTTAEVREQRRQVTRLMRHPKEHPNRQAHPSGTLIHYALDLESPPLIACDAPEPELSSPTASEVTCPDCLATEHFPRSSVTVDMARTAADITQPPTITANDVLKVAADLLVDANYDYTKAIVDMTSELLGAGPHDTILMTRILRSLAQGD
jgi:hypothetical protein